MQNNTIQLPKDFAPQIREYYLTRLKQLETESLEIKNLISHLDAPTQLSIIDLPFENAGNITGYSSKWTMLKKAKFVLSKASKAMTSKEIVDFIIDNYEPEAINFRKKFMSSMSGTLSAKSKEGLFSREQNEADDFEYLNV